jgi:hypothetical protein
VLKQPVKKQSRGHAFSSFILFCGKKNEPGFGAEPHYLINQLFYFFCHFLRGQKVTKNLPESPDHRLRRKQVGDSPGKKKESAQIEQDLVEHSHMC